MGPPTCGMGGIPGVDMGHECKLVRVAAGLPMNAVYEKVSDTFFG